MKLKQEFIDEMARRVFKLQTDISEATYGFTNGPDTKAWKEWGQLTQKMRIMLEKYDDKYGFTFSKFKEGEDEYLKTLLGLKEKK